MKVQSSGVGTWKMFKQGRGFIPWPMFVEAGRHCQNLLAKAEGGVKGPGPGRRLL